jgi:hypothetical protein
VTLLPSDLHKKRLGCAAARAFGVHKRVVKTATDMRGEMEDSCAGIESVGMSTNKARFLKPGKYSHLDGSRLISKLTFRASIDN